MRIEDLGAVLCCALPFALPLFLAWLAARWRGTLDFLEAAMEFPFDLIVGAAVQTLDAKEAPKKNLGICSVFCAVLALGIGGSYAAFGWIVGRGLRSQPGGPAGLGIGIPLGLLIIGGLFVVLVMELLGVVGYVLGRTAWDASRGNWKDLRWGLAGVALNLVILSLPLIGFAFTVIPEVLRRR